MSDWQYNNNHPHCSVAAPEGYAYDFFSLIFVRSPVSCFVFDLHLYPVLRLRIVGTSGD
jgi:hypothetical protein